MSALNWKDCAGTSESYLVSEANASHEVGGRYWIHCWRTIFQVAYYPGFGHNWKIINRIEPGTLAEAKRMAEEDHERRRQHRPA